MVDKIPFSAITFSSSTPTPANSIMITDSSGNITTGSATIDTRGNLGIGTTTPLATLHVTGTHINTGNVGIGTSSTTGITAGNVLTVFGNVNVISPSGAFLVNGVAIGGGGGSVSITDDVATNTNEYLLSARVTSGTATTVYTASTRLYFNPSTGTLSANFFNSLSDASLKTNVSSFNGEELINQINPVSYTWKESGKKILRCDCAGT